MQTLTAVIESFWAAFEANDIDGALRRHLAEDCEFVMPGMPPLRGHAQIRPFFQGYRAAFPDMRHRTVHAIESDGTYAAETTYSGTHNGALRGPRGEIPPTGRAVSWHSADIVRIRDGRVVSWHVYHDPTALMSQLV